MAQSARRSRRAPSSSLTTDYPHGTRFHCRESSFRGPGCRRRIRDWGCIQRPGNGWWNSLGYGWIPAGMWLVAALAALRYHRHSRAHQLAMVGTGGGFSHHLNRGPICISDRRGNPGRNESERTLGWRGGRYSCMAWLL